MSSPRRLVLRSAAVVLLAGGFHVDTSTPSPADTPDQVVVRVDETKLEVAVGDKTFGLADLEPWTENGPDDAEQVVFAAWALDADPSQTRLDEIAEQTTTTTTTTTTSSTVPTFAPMSSTEPVAAQPAAPLSDPEADPEPERPEHDHAVETVPWREEIFDTEPPTDLTSAVKRLEEASEIVEQAEADLAEREHILAVADRMVRTLEDRVEQRHVVLVEVEEQTRTVATAMYVRGQMPPAIFDEIDVSSEPLVERHLNDRVVDETVDVLVAATDAHRLASTQALIAVEVQSWAERKRDETEAVLEEAEEAVAEAEMQRALALASMNRGTGNLAHVPAVTGAAIQVDANLAPALAALMEQARADGIPLGGWGWRSPERTAELRIVNGCPDVSESPPSACATPTARPGTSMHEQGLAIDFTCDGSTVQRGTVCDRWLMENGPRYGLANLPSEAWHYSTNGR